MPYKTKEKRREYNMLKRDAINKTRQKHDKLWRLVNPKGYKLLKMRGRQRLQALKIEVLTHYGKGKCGCIKCGEARLACLSIDHSNGKQSLIYEDKTPAGKVRHGRDLYCWLRMSGYPKGYQTLCMNCQWVKRYENGETGGRRDNLSIGGEITSDCL